LTKAIIALKVSALFSQRRLNHWGEQMEKSRKTIPAELKSSRRNAIQRKALERQKLALLKRAQQGKVVGPIPQLQNPTPSAPPGKAP
jgi:hypothetical protein